MRQTDKELAARTILAAAPASTVAPQRSDLGLVDLEHVNAIAANTQLQSVRDLCATIRVLYDRLAVRAAITNNDIKRRAESAALRIYNEVEGVPDVPEMVLVIVEEFTAPASPVALRDEAGISIDQAAAAVYRKYGANLAGFWRDAFAAEAQRHGRNEIEQYGVDGNCIHCIPICQRCRLTTIEFYLKEKGEIRAATTPPSTLAKAAAESVYHEMFKLGGLDEESVVNQIATIIERCFSAREDQKVE